MPTKVFGGPGGILGTITTGGVTVDMDRGADGKFYVSQQRTAGNEPGLIVVDPSTGTKLWDSLATSRTLLSDPAAHDIITTLTQIAISPDDKYLAGMLNFSQVLVLPLVNGIPDLANRSVVNTPTPVNSGRDIAFDAADNIHYVSSGQGVYRVLTPGGHTLTTLSFDGTTYAFTNSNVVANDADYNNDGKVDGADFLIWQRGQGGAGNNGAGDANGDGQVNAADLAAWKAAFGGSATAAVAGVPEPGSLCLLAFAGMFGLAARGRRSA
jgi:hypothetical protein